MKILLFTGAGTSIPSNLPSTKKIMELLLTGSWRGERDKITDGWIFQPHDKSPKYPRDPTDNAQSFLKLIKSYADGYYALRTGRESNYEDLYYLARQICEDAVNTLENPAIGIFIDELKLRVLGTKQFAGQETELKTLAGQCCSLIHSVVFHELSQKVGQIEGLNLVGKLANDSRIEKLDICTLNHDLLFEEYLQSPHADCVGFNDGFRAESENANVRVFNHVNFDIAAKVRLFKLHGSINWHRFASKQDKDAPHKFGILENSDPLHYEDDKLKLATNAPEFLTGTYNKLAAYGAHIYADFQHWFHRLLREHKIILISGYGWGDSAINQRLFEWFFLCQKNNRMVLMYEKSKIEELLKSFKDPLRESLLIRIKQQNQVFLIEKWMKDTQVEEIFQLLDSSQGGSGGCGQ
jgi:hypothetical protein